MAKVLKGFYSISRKKAFKPGDEVDGDIDGWVKEGLVEKQVEPKAEDKDGAPKKRRTKADNRTKRKK